VRTITLVILPPTALTVIPRLGLVSVRPSAGVINNRTPVDAAPLRACALTWLAARVAPPKQPATDRPSIAQIGTDARRRLDDR
jgi:hypothetical protein